MLPDDQMIPLWLQAFAIVSLLLAFVSALMIGVNLLRRPQPMAIMNAVWPITALYLGPVAVWWYLTLGRTAGHEHHRQLPFWKSIIVEATHCGAGCTLGDVVAEVAIYSTGFSIGGSMLLTEYVGDFMLAYAFGI